MRSPLASPRQRLVVALCATLLVTGALTLVPSAQPAKAALPAPLTRAFFDADFGHTNHVPKTFGAPRSISATGYVSLSYSDGAGQPNYSVLVQAPLGQTLQVGAYETVDFAQSSHRLGIGIDGRACQGRGRVVIDQLQFNADDELIVLSMRAEKDCGSITAIAVVSLNATADFRTRTLDQGRIRFGGVGVGGFSATRFTTLANHGPSTLAVANVVLNGDHPGEFTIVENSCTGRVLQGGQTCRVGVAFIPTAVNVLRTARLTFYDDLNPQAPLGLGRSVQLEGAGVTALGPDGEFTPLNPARIFDTRTGTGGRLGAIVARQPVEVQIAGVGEIPLTGVSAVAFNATVTNPSAQSYLTIWPSGVERPDISNLNYVAGQTVANLVTVAVGDNGRISLYNDAGRTDVLLDVVGYYSDSDGPYGSRFQALPPQRLYDSRDDFYQRGPIRSGQTLPFAFLGQRDIPNSPDVTALVLTVTTTQSEANGYVTVYPEERARPTASNVNTVANRSVANLVIVPATFVTALYNFGGNTHVVIDVAGYFHNRPQHGGGRLITGTPFRSIDTRRSSPFAAPGALPPGEILAQRVPDTDIGAVVYNITAAAPSAAGYITAFPLDAALPTASNVNFEPLQVVPNLAIVPVGGNRLVGFYNSAGHTHLIIDVFGLFTSHTAPP